MLQDILEHLSILQLYLVPNEALGEAAYLVIIMIIFPNV